MALIKCNECGNQMSDKASACPHCGCPNDVIEKEETVKLVKASRLKEKCNIITILLSIVILIALFIVYVLNIKNIEFIYTLRSDYNFYEGLVHSPWQELFFAFGALNYGLLAISCLLRYKSIKFNKLYKIINFINILALFSISIAIYTNEGRVGLQYILMFALTIVNFLIPRIGKLIVEDEKVEKETEKLINENNKKLDNIYNKYNKKKEIILSTILIIISCILLGITYYISNSSLKDDLTKQKTKNLKITINTNYINIREEPNTNSKIVGKAVDEEEYEVLDIYGGVNYIWYYIKDGKTKGYISSSRNNDKLVLEKWDNKKVIVIFTSEYCTVCDEYINNLKEEQDEYKFHLLILEDDHTIARTEKLDEKLPTIVIGNTILNENNIEKTISLYESNNKDNTIINIKKKGANIQYNSFDNTTTESEEKPSTNTKPSNTKPSNSDSKPNNSNTKPSTGANNSKKCNETLKKQYEEEYNNRIAEEDKKYNENYTKAKQELDLAKEALDITGGYVSDNEYEEKIKDLKYGTAPYNLLKNRYEMSKSYDKLISSFNAIPTAYNKWKEAYKKEYDEKLKNIGC